MMRENSDHKSSPRAPARVDMTSGDNRSSSTDNFEVEEPPSYRFHSSRKPYSDRTEDSEDDSEQEKERSEPMTCRKRTLSMRPGAYLTRNKWMI